MGLEAPLWGRRKVVGGWGGVICYFLFTIGSRKTGLRYGFPMGRNARKSEIQAGIPGGTNQNQQTRNAKPAQHLISTGVMRAVRKNEGEKTRS